MRRSSISLPGLEEPLSLWPNSALTPPKWLVCDELSLLLWESSRLARLAWAAGVPSLAVRHLIFRLGILVLAAGAALAQGGRMTLETSAFSPGQPIPQKYSCEGADVSPPLTWSAPPPGTKSFALIVDD